MNSMPPPYSKDVRYSKIPQSAPQYEYSVAPPYPPPSSYAPAPPVMQQQSSNAVSVRTYCYTMKYSCSLTSGSPLMRKLLNISQIFRKRRAWFEASIAAH